MASAGPLPIDARWAEHATWDDGLAEIATYRASRVIYGAPRPYEAVLITVKEDFDADALVKADAPYGNRSIVTVIKQNALREIPTPNYPYRMMTSTFVRRSDPTGLLKLTSGSHEWCGNTWKVVRNRDGRAVYEWQSYFDGEVDGRQSLTLGPGDLLEDQLPLALRGLDFRAGLSFEARLLPSMADTHGGPETWRTVRFEVVGRERLELPVGPVDAWRVEASSADGGSTWWFDAESVTHPLVRMESAGERFELARIQRRAYWVLP